VLSFTFSTATFSTARTSHRQGPSDHRPTLNDLCTQTGHWAVVDPKAVPVTSLSRWPIKVGERQRFETIYKPSHPFSACNAFRLQLVLWLAALPPSSTPFAPSNTMKSLSVHCICRAVSSSPRGTFSCLFPSCASLWTPFREPKLSELRTRANVN